MEDGISLFSRLPSAKQGSKSKQGSASKTTNQKLNSNEKPNAHLDSHNGEDPGVGRSNAAHAATTSVSASSKRTAESLEIDETASFRDLGLSEWLDKVCTSLGMTHPTLVQRGCIPAILQGRDVIGVAHTGSGKTAAFALPILQRLSKDPYGIFALVLTPTRELAFQLADQFRALGAGQTLKESVVIGGLDMQAQTKELARRPHVVIATPGRLRQLLSLDSDLAPAFRRASFLVLDEADRLLEPTFESDLAAIMQILPEERQTLLFFRYYDEDVDRTTNCTPT
ncbi:hypothetical protein Ndes2437A_g05378 [Nannochloris sp. 'desiccata']|nr:hypothetical protein KSW81_007402 [Chlorella desiccata (nom. nud.)]